VGLLTKFKKIDWPIVIILFSFMVISTLIVYSATVSDTLLGSRSMHIKNLLNYAFGFFVLIGALLFDYRILLKGAYYIYGVGITLLITVYFFGIEIHGSKSWFELPIGGFNFQPAELMKLIIIITVAYFISKREGDTLQVVQDVVPMGIIVFVPFVLVLIQPDLGNAIIYFVIFVGMLWIGNVKYMHALIGLAIIGICMGLFLYFYQTYHDSIYAYLLEKGSSHWVERIDTFLEPENADPNAIYQVRNSIRAIGSGQLFGDSFLNGNSVHNNFIPYTYSDSIFVVIGEEFGFLGSSLLLLLYFLFIYRMILISIQTENLAGSYIIIGIVSMYVFQVFQNIGMLMGIMPLTGITLPFISYGGSSLIINMLSIGIVLSVKIHQEKTSTY
jgi:rod shape determining protein RodA